MTKQVQRRRGTATQHTSFTGAEGELSVNTTNKSVHVHDGSTAGGIELARKDGSNVAFTSGTLDGVTIGGSTAGAGTFTNLTATGTTTLAGASTSANITFGDNDKAIFGAGSDLQIYHDGSNSYVAESGAGSLILGGSAGVFIKNHALDEFYIQAYQNGEVKLYYDNAAKLATTSTGIDVTGTVTADGLTVDGDVRLDGGASGSDRYLRFTEVFSSIQNAGFYFHLDGTDDDLYIGRHDTADTNVANDKPVIGIDRGTGDISFYEDTGTTAKFFWDASLETLTLGGTEWPSSTIGEAAGRHMINYDGEPRLLLWDASTGAAGNEAHIMIGGKPVNSATQFSGATISAGVENGTDADGYLAISTTNSASTSVEHMRITSSGSVGIGTSSPSAPLTVKSSGQAGEVRMDSDGGAGRISSNGDLQFYTNNSAYSIQFKAPNDGTEHMRITSSGDVGIGTSSPDRTLDVNGVAGFGNGTIETIISYSDRGIFGTQSNHDLEIRTNATERMRIDSSGNVGIGTTSPSASLTVTDGSSAGTLSIGDNAAGSTSVRYLQFGESNDYSIQSNANSYLRFYAEGAEAMRLDSSGNLLVGKTSTNVNSVGVEARGNGLFSAARASNPVAYFTRTTDDGDIVKFYKDTATVGSIGSYSSGLDIAGSSRGVRFSGSTIFPVTNAGGVSDNSVQLGYSGGRFKDLYLSGGVYLGGTGSANKLDDYEEGTWTPTFSSGTATLRYRRYTKIGDVVHFWMEVELTGTRGSETFTISGLPFNANYFQACSGYAQGYTDEGSQGFAPFVRQNTGQIRINSFGADIIGTKLGNGYLNISGTYRTA